MYSLLLYASSYKKSCFLHDSIKKSYYLFANGCNRWSRNKHCVIVDDNDWKHYCYMLEMNQSVVNISR